MAIALLDRDGAILEHNDALAGLLACDPFELRGCRFEELPKLFANGEGELTAASGSDTRFVRKDGVTLWGRSTTWPIAAIAPGDPVEIGLIEDISDLKRAERKLHAEQTLAEIGRMAALVAHQVKNPLAGIGGAVQIIRERFPEAASERQILKQIHDRLMQLDATVDALVDYARARDPEMVSVSLSGPVRAAVDRTRSAFPGIEIATTGRADVLIFADQPMIESLVDHLLVNAAEAMGGAGRVVLSVGSDTRSWRLEVSDSGPGCVDGEQVFAPFYSTKPHGAGLGLAVARRIAEAHGGELWCESRPGDGAVFVADMPRHPIA